MTPTRSRTRTCFTPSGRVVRSTSAGWSPGAARRGGARGDVEDASSRRERAGAAAGAAGASSRRRAPAAPAASRAASARSRPARRRRARPAVPGFRTVIADGRRSPQRQAQRARAEPDAAAGRGTRDGCRGRCEDQPPRARVSLADHRERQRRGVVPGRHDRQRRDEADARRHDVAPVRARAARRGEGQVGAGRDRHRRESSRLRRRSRAAGRAA